MKKFFTVMTVAILAAALVGVLGACSKSTQAKAGEAFVSANSAYADFDLGKSVTLYLYMLGDPPKDMEEVLAKANAEYFKPMLNTTLEIVFLAWSDYMTKYPLILSAGEDVDIIFTAPWCFYEQEAAKGSYLELTDDFIAAWMPNVKASLGKIPWQQAKTGGKIYGVPTRASGSVYKYYAIRDDLRVKYNLAEPNSWEALENYLFTIAAKEPGIQAYAAAGEAPEVCFVYLEAKDILYSGDPVYMIWKNDNQNQPTAEDLSFLYTSDVFRDFALEMAEWAQKGVWSKNAMNNTVAQGDSFTQGKSASVFWNATVFSLGKTMETNGVGKAGYYQPSSTVPTRKESYDNNMWAIASSTPYAERAALALDMMKTNNGLNMLLRGGIEGRHYTAKGDGYELGPEAADYPFDGWTWALRERQIDEAYDTALYAQRYELEQSINNRNFEPVIDGFRFDRSGIAGEWAVISSLIEEYTPSFECGVYGAQTQAKFDEFKLKLAAAGLAKVETSFLTQYAVFLKSN